MIDLTKTKKNAFHTKGVEFPGSQGFSADDLYDTKEEALAVVCAKNEKIKDNYRHQINNINELLNFMLNNTTNHCEEYSDNEARDVAIEKMKEFNFTVED